MYKLTRVVVLVVGLMSAFAAMAGAASASSWTNSGSTAFTGTAGAGTLSTSSSTLTCTGSTATGTAPATEAGPNYTLTATATFSGCRLAGITTAVTCTQTITGRSPVSGGVTNGTSPANCSVTQGGREVCRVTGTLTGNYRNAATGSPGVLSIDATSALSTANGSGGSCPLGVTSSASLRGSGASGATVFTTTAGSGGSGVLGPVLSQPQ